MKFWWGFIIAIALCVVVAIIVGISMVGKKANVPPSRLEAFLANELKHLRIPEAPMPATPVARTDENTLTGGEHFNHHCAGCHDLEGDADNKFAKSFYPPVANLLSKNVQGYTDRQLKWIVDGGIRYTGMPAWSELIDEPTQWKIVYYMRALANSTDAKRFEEMLKEKGKWKVEAPTSHEHGEEEGEAGEKEKASEAGAAQPEQGATSEQQGESATQHHEAESPAESKAEPAEKGEK